jgi:hypothetical protein
VDYRISRSERSNAKGGWTSSFLRTMSGDSKTFLCRLLTTFTDEEEAALKGHETEDAYQSYVNQATPAGTPGNTWAVYHPDTFKNLKE